MITAHAARNRMISNEFWRLLAAGPDGLRFAAGPSATSAADETVSMSDQLQQALVRHGSHASCRLGKDSPVNVTSATMSKGISEPMAGW